MTKTEDKLIIIELLNDSILTRRYKNRRRKQIFITIVSRSSNGLIIALKFLRNMKTEFSGIGEVIALIIE